MKTQKTLTLSELSTLSQSKLVGDPKYLIKGVNDLKTAGKEDASFLANPRYRDLLQNTSAGVVCIGNSIEPIPGKNFLISNDPSRTFQQIAELLLGHDKGHEGFQGVHPTALIHETAKIGKDVTIGPYAVIDKDAEIGPNTVIYPHVYIGSATTIGSECTIYPSIIRERCTIKNRVIIQPGAIIGSCGFGYTHNPKTGEFTKLEQLGTVIIEDDVEVGANTTIDRARFGATLISKGTKIDNLVQIAHNVTLGENNAVVSQSGIAGSAKTGKNVLLGGQSGIVGHVEITDNVQIATRGGVSKSIKKPGPYGGGPVIPLKDFNKQQVQLRKIDTYIKRIEALEKRLDTLESITPH